MSEMRQLKVQVSNEAYMAFKAKVLREGRQMSETVRDFMAQYTAYANGAFALVPLEHVGILLDLVRYAVAMRAEAVSEGAGAGEGPDTEKPEGLVLSEDVFLQVLLKPSQGNTS